MTQWKKQVGQIDATPSKRLYLSIIADYEPKIAICELVDNALDIWKSNNDPTFNLSIKIILDQDQQFLSITDNAGGFEQENLSFLVSPGQTGSDPDFEGIGIFGVGTKRASVALAEEIRIRTRSKNDQGYIVEYNDDWLKNDSWDLPYYTDDSIAISTTKIEFSRLRFKINTDFINSLKTYLSEIYSKFIKSSNIDISVNEEKLNPIDFDKWSYPPEYPPRNYYGDLLFIDESKVRYSITAGLSSEASPIKGDYGVYFYCNDRLIVKTLKTSDVGFISGVAGLPHPRLSLTKIIINLNGPVKLMPWNSSKSNINTSNKVFLEIQPHLFKLIKYWASLSRRFEGNWKEEIEPYRSGKVVSKKLDSISNLKITSLPPLPKVRENKLDTIITTNKNIIAKKPWVKGLYEGIYAVDLITKKNLSQKNRLNLIILDSTLEISYKEYLVNDSGTYYSDAQIMNIFKNRNTVQTEIKKYIRISKNDLKIINYYYNLRCKLIHERATVLITDDQIRKYQNIVTKMLKKLFGLKI